MTRWKTDEIAISENFSSHDIEDLLDHEEYSRRNYLPLIIAYKDKFYNSIVDYCNLNLFF